MAGKSVAKYVVTATGKVDGKTQIWIAGVFASVVFAKPWVAILNLARKAGDVDTVKSMDVNAPLNADGSLPTGVAYKGASVQYNPQADGLSDDTTLG